MSVSRCIVGAHKLVGRRLLVAVELVGAAPPCTTARVAARSSASLPPAIFSLLWVRLGKAGLSVGSSGPEDLAAGEPSSVKAGEDPVHPALCLK